MASIDFQRRFEVPEGGRELLLVRHGSTATSPTGAPPPGAGGRSLNADGRAQAEAVAARLAGAPLAGVVVSSLRRTHETAAPLLAARGLEAIELADLREVELGDWTDGELSRRAARGDPEFRRVLRAQRWDVIPNAETADAFGERVRRGLDAAVGAGGEARGPVVVFTHGGVIAEACRQVTGSEPFAFLVVANGSFTRIGQLDSGRRLLLSFSETGHLG